MCRQEWSSLVANVQADTDPEVMGLISMCFDSIYFRFRGHIYHHRKGTPMGSPISVVVAEVVMQQFEAELLRTVPQSLKLWVRYVDDVFAVMQDKDIDPFFTRLNSLEPAIQFSMELEVNVVLPLLDILVSRGDNLETSLYRKPTHTGRLLDYDSYHPDYHKRSLIRTLWNRADKICSTTDVWDRALNNSYCFDLTLIEE
ncbi:uncharacterized protein LOC143017522 [Oratosquilla oratoria]|uniref:uncharacterized protein LOC143017522 n=1 Tax=Oratosquilla oratoria TaxID=337810 RepID=UPI003F765F0C